MIEWENLTLPEKHAVKLLGEQDPLTFTRLWFQITQGEKLKVNWHHRYFNKIALNVLSGKTQNAIINVAPGSTKTEFFSIHLPAYCFAKYKRVRTLNTSYSKDLVSENSERTRSIIKSAEWQEIYPHIIGKDKVDDWTINNDQGKRAHQMFSRPSGGQITGVRGGYMTQGDFSGYLMLDDWQKPEDLFSETKRNSSNRRVSNTLRSRRADDKTPIISIQQRLHVEDVTGFLMGGGLGMKFEQIKIPALINDEYIQGLPDDLRDRCWSDIKDTQCINGYYSFFPAKEDVQDLMNLWESDPYTFTSQYLQAPEQLSGGIFKPDAFQFYSLTDEHDDGEILGRPPYWEYRFITADTAQKTKERNDFSVFAHWGVYQGRVYLIKLVRGKWEAPALRSQALSLINEAWALNKNSPINGNLRSVLVEDKSSGTGLIQEISRTSPINVTAVQRSIDKTTRAMDCQRHQHSGKVVLPYGEPANLEFISEVASFSADDSHPHDDQTDVMMDAIDFAIIKASTGPSAAVLRRRR